MSQAHHDIESQRQALKGAKGKSAVTQMKVWSKLCGPGWLQSAITLGGGSLAGSLYLGVIGGYQLLWLQPLMMILGIVMLGAISYVTLTTGKRPFQAINEHINPVLGWGWAIATLMANMVWAMPQFSLGTAAMEQNIGIKLPTPVLICILFALAAGVILMYDRGGRGVRIFEGILKSMVAIVVVSFFAVVVVLTFGEPGLPWGKILAGFIPDFGLLGRVADGFVPYIEASSDPQYWRDTILSIQRDNMIAAAATAVGINMTFLLPYSMLKKKWDRDFRGLAVFDLATGLFIPFMIATSCVVLAAASQFHATYDPGLTGEGEPAAMTSKLQGSYTGHLKKRLAASKEHTPEQIKEQGAELMAALPLADKRIAAMLVQRDSMHLAQSLEKLTGPTVAQTIFGIGVLGMALSTIIILMLINGFTICEMMGKPSTGLPHRLGAMIPGITGALGFYFLWGDANARFWLAVPTSVFGMVLLPIAYVTFFFMMNSRKLMGADLPSGRTRIIWNSLMALAIIAASIGSLYAINSKAGTYGLIGLGAFIILVVVGGLARKSTSKDT